MEYQESQIFTEKAVNYASFGQRLGAAIIDGIIVGVVNLLLTYLLSGSILNEDGDLLPTIASVVTGWLYGAVQESSAKQATIGKSLLRIRVTMNKVAVFHLARPAGATLQRSFQVLSCL